MGNISAESPLIFLILITGDIPTGVSGTGTLAGVTVVFCQVLFPEKSVEIPCFRQGIFPTFGGH